MADDNATTDRLRKDIDDGKGGDKAPASDPAASPLGTDAEAGGTPPGPAAIETAHRHEVEARPTATHPNAATDASPQELQGAEGQRRTQSRSITAIVVVVVVVILLLLIL